MLISSIVRLSLGIKDHRVGSTTLSGSNWKTRIFFIIKSTIHSDYDMLLVICLNTVISFS